MYGNPDSIQESGKLNDKPSPTGRPGWQKTINPVQPAVRAGKYDKPKDLRTF